MSEFRAHVRAGLAVHAFLTAGASAAYLATFVGEVVLLVVAGCLPVTLVGAIFPDLDHHASIPSRFVRRYGPDAVVVGLSIALYANRRVLVAWCGALPLDHSAGYLAGIVSAAAVLTGYHGTDRLIPIVRPRHRGVTHRVPVAIALSGTAGVCALVSSVALYVPRSGSRIVATVVAGTFLVGYLSHLHRDDLLGKWETYVTVR